MQRIVIGDIHGCYDELQALLDLVGPGDDRAGEPTYELRR